MQIKNYVAKNQSYLRYKGVSKTFVDLGGGIKIAYAARAETGSGTTTGLS